MSKNNELHALISLLDEPDLSMYNKIRKKIISYGIDAIPVLENAWENSFDSTTQQRIEYITHTLQMESLYVDFNNWAFSNQDDMLEGFILLTRHKYPDLNVSRVINQIEKIKQDTWLELNDQLTALEKVKVINHIFYEIYKFAGNKTNIHSPQNSYINNVLETKKGNPISLGILYMIISQRLNLPVFGVNLPQHFILAYANEYQEINKKPLAQKDILFYINPFNKGAVFTRREVDLFIKQLKLKPNKSYYTPCDNITIIKRLADNLKYGYEKMGYPDKVAELDKLTGSLL
ncbi:MAG: transglutaminase family protein [Bacteroidales bacterium]|nr:transglutaminase family protein [Bacteroidales bacterium]